MSNSNQSSRSSSQSMPPMRGGPGGRRAGMMRVPGMGSKNPKKTIKRLLAYILKPNMFALIFVFICIGANALASVKGSLFLRTLIDDYIEPMVDANKSDFPGLARAILQMAGIYAVGIGAALARGLIMAKITQTVLKKIRDEMFTKMQKLPISYFDRNSIGDIMSHYTNDTDTLRQVVSQTIPQVVSSFITIISVFVAMVRMNYVLTLIVIAFVVLMLKVSSMTASKSGSYFVKQQRSLGGLNGYIEEMIGGQKVIKVFCHEDETKAEFDKRNEELRLNASSANTFASILMPINGTINYLQYLTLAVIGGAMAINGFIGFSLGSLISFLTLSKNFSMPINRLSQELNSIVMALAGAERIFELMDEAPEVNDGYVTLVNAKRDEAGNIVEAKENTDMWAWKHPHSDGTVTYTELTGEVTFTDVDFAYKEGVPVLNDITLYAKPGQKVAFVGATGAGKTTITNLINRFYDIADGKIRYDGININKINKVDLRHSLGIVLQDTNLFTGTVMENIRFGKLDATEEEVYAAAKLANAHDFIMRLPEGYDTMLTGNGASLSHGQRQLIAIARAAVANPPVMILDEATSSIDTRTEALVQKGMDSLMNNRTVFVIAHRLSTVMNADVIMVMDHGHIIERGTHEQLLAEKGTYYSLYTGAVELD